jgi:hypothetical protein
MPETISPPRAHLASTRPWRCAIAWCRRITSPFLRWFEHYHTFCWFSNLAGRHHDFLQDRFAHLRRMQEMGGSWNDQCGSRSILWSHAHVLHVGLDCTDMGLCCSTFGEIEQNFRFPFRIARSVGPCR